MKPIHLRHRDERFEASTHPTRAETPNHQLVAPPRFIFKLSLFKKLVPDSMVSYACKPWRLESKLPLLIAFLILVHPPQRPFRIRILLFFFSSESSLVIPVGLGAPFMGLRLCATLTPGPLYLSSPNHAWQSKISKSRQDRSAIPRLHTQTGTPSPPSLPMRLTFLLLPCTILASTVSAVGILGRDTNPPTCCVPCLTSGTNNVSFGDCPATDGVCLCSSTAYVQGVINCIAYVMSHRKILLFEG